MVALVGLLGWAAVHLGALDLTSTVTDAGGVTVSVPVTWAAVDHPFHVARAEALLDALRDGHLLRWVGSHEGGYPVEFYPLGVAWLTIGVWALALGSIPVAAAFKLTVIAIFLAPVLAFAALGRTRRQGVMVAGVAMVAHLAVPGIWWGGGYTELIAWGLVTNVAAYVAAFAFLPALASFLSSGSRWPLALAIGTASFAVATNTRSVIALGCVTIATGAVLVLHGRRAGVGRLAIRLAGVAVPVALLTAPLWVSTLRFTDEYEFIRYQWYDDVGAWWQSTLDAASWPVTVGAGIGLVLAVVRPSAVRLRVVALTLVLYVVATGLLAGFSPDGGLIQQLEATRMMPFQRLLMIGLAAMAVVEMVGSAGRSVRRAAAVDIALLGATAVAAVALVIQPLDRIEGEDRSMFPVVTTGDARYADALAAVTTADALAPPGTGLLVIGSELGWHQPLWAPTVTDRPLRYDNWLWLWQTWLRGDGLRYVGQAVAPDDFGDLVDGDELRQWGIGAVVSLTDTTAGIAGRSDALARVPGDGYAVFLVEEPTGTVQATGGSVTTSRIEVDTGAIDATVEGPGGPVTVAQTWFPRWRAMVNGDSVPVERDELGRIRIDVPAGRSIIQFRYVVDRIDWLCRALAAAGLLLTLTMLVPNRTVRRLEPPVGREAGRAPGAPGEPGARTGTIDGVSVA